MSHLFPENKIVSTAAIILAAVAISAAYYFIFYFFCLLLIKSGYVCAFDNCSQSSLSGSVFNLSGENGIITAVATSSSPSSSSSSSPSAASSSAVSIISSEPAQPELAPNIADPTLVFGSYFDTFANSLYIDHQRTTLYYDENATAYIFPPDYSFVAADVAQIDPADKNILDSVSLNTFENLISDKRCLGKECLTQKGKDLFLDDAKLSLPAELAGRDIAAVSIGALQKRWLVGFTVKNKTDYEGLAYYFDGQKFSQIWTPAPIISPYFGVFGFGGGENNFLVIYGAKQGIAYHIQGDKVSDISHFFDARMMNGGFKAEALFTAFENNVNWYVYSSNLYHPILIKLWQNKSAEIVGETAFKDIFTSYDEAAVFKLSRTESGAITLAAKLRRENRDYWFYFTDRGFKDENGGSLVSAPIAHDGNASLITIAKIAESRLGVDAPSADRAAFLFSVNGQNWQKIGSGKNIDVSVPATRYFFLSAVFPKSDDKFYSPFVDEILFDYYCRK